MLKSLSTSLTALFGLFNLIAGIWMLAQGIELRRTDKTLHPVRPGKPEKEGGPSDVWTRGTTSECRSSSGRTVDARQLWSGGAGTAVVAALIALVGILVCRWLASIPVLAPRQDGAWGDASTAGYAIAAAALVATAIMLLLGAAIGSLINGPAARVIRRRAVTGGY